MSTPRDDQPGRQGGLNPAALSVADAARMLTHAGGQLITEAMIERDIEDGFQTNGDGTINLVHFAAWLVRDLAERGGGDRGGD